MFDVLLGMENKNSKKRAKQLLQVIGRLGLAIIKAGQDLQDEVAAVQAFTSMHNLIEQKTEDC